MRRLVLLGGGHAHAQVLLGLRDFVSRELEVRLVSPGPFHVYSGMVPGVIAGHYRSEDARIDLARLARDAAGSLVEGRVRAIDPGRRCVTLEDGSELGYDLLSLNLGSLPGLERIAGAGEHAIGARPFEPLITAWGRWMSSPAAEVRIAILGAGAGGVELAMAMIFDARRRGRGTAVSLYSDRLAFSPELGMRIRASLDRLGVVLRAQTAVTAVEPGPVVVTAGGQERFDAVFCAAGASALPLLRKSGLQTDAGGFVLVNSGLQSVSHPAVFAAGDCASLQDGPVPKSGVYAVRQGAVLAENLKRAIVGRPLKPYRPQASSLYLVSCGGRYAIASRGGWYAEGAWAWRWKDWIDRRWIAKFR